MPRPSLPSLVSSMRCAPAVEKVMSLVVPPAASARPPSFAVTDSAPLLCTTGVVREAVAVTAVPRSVVKTPVEGLLLPMAVALMVPPPMATSLVWN